MLNHPVAMDTEHTGGNGADWEGLCIGGSWGTGFGERH